MMGRRIYRDIEIRGVVYPDAGSAAAAHGVSAQAVRVAVRKGTQHRGRHGCGWRRAHAGLSRRTQV